MDSQTKTQIIARRKAGATLVEIGKEFGISRTSVHRIVGTASYEYHTDTEEILKLRKQGYLVAEIAEKLGISRGAIWRACKKEGVTFSREKLSQPQKEQIKEMRTNGAGMQQIAKEFGISIALAYKITKGIPVLKKQKPGIGVTWPGKKTEAEVLEMIERRKAGATIAKIAKEFSLSPPTVMLILGKNSKKDYTDEILQTLKEGKTIRETASILGIGQAIVRRATKKAGIAKISKNNEKKRQRIRMRESGATLAEIATAFGVSIGAIQKQLGKGSRKYYTAEILRLREQGYNGVKIAKELGISYPTVKKIINRMVITDSGEIKLS
jgi:DNA-binding CsgD family transcriptional regulator